MFISAFVRAMAFVDVVVGALAARVRTRHAGMRLSPAAVRGVTFIEYALLASIAVAVGLLFRTNLTSIFTTLMGKLRAGI